MANKRILIIGYFGHKSNQLDGQTIKTRNVYNLLKIKRDEIGECDIFDTEEYKYSKLSLIKMITKIVRSKIIIYLPAHNNLKYLFPILLLICKSFNIKIHYIVIGGWLTEFLNKNMLHRRLIKYIDLIFPENKQLCKDLVYYTNSKKIILFNNFRIHNFHPHFHSSNDIFNIVFMARINEMKGIYEIFKLAEYLQKKINNIERINIDFYGPICSKEKSLFLNKINNNPTTKYKGEILPENIYETLNKYDVMILPTKYYTEGFPGSILDAYISGIPVIATNWKHASEFIDHYKTGYIIPFDNGFKELTERIIELFYDRNLLHKMKKNAFEKSKIYSTENTWRILKPHLIK